MRSAIANYSSEFLLLVLLTGCSLFGEKSGACVSSAVEFSFGARVYCYSGWDPAECRDFDSRQVNGASWSFHKGQSCADRDLEDGGNDWP